MEIGTLFFPTLWHLTFPEQAVNDINSAESTSNSHLLTCEWGSLSPRSVKTSELPAENIWFTCKFLEHCLMAVPRRLKADGVILAKENSILWQSATVFSGDWQIALHQSPLKLTLSVVWLWSIDIVIGLWKVLFDYFYMKAVQKRLLIQSTKIWAEKLADKLLEYSLCSDKLLNFHWTCILRKGSFSKRKIHQTTYNFSFTYLRKMFDLVRK